MNLYHKKQRWKILLVVIAVILVGFSLWFSNNVVNKVAEKEKDRVSQWADAISRKADLMTLTNSSFDELRENERKKVEMWSLSLQEINKDLTDYSFVLEILKQNSNQPMIVTNQDGVIENTHHLDYLDSLFYKQLTQSFPNKNIDSLVKLKIKDTLEKCINEWPKTHPPIILNLFGNQKQTVYYYDSRKLSQLTNSKDSLFKAFTNELINNKDLVPVVFINQSNRKIVASNRKEINDSLSVENLSTILTQISNTSDSIQINLGNEKTGIIYFEPSEELTILKYFPIVQFIIIGLFILIGYLVFSTFRKAEQDQVWVGMAKETAHQLGTPISSLMAWTQLLEAQGVEPSTILEMNKDIDRLNTVTNRFSKIGSKAILKPENIVDIIDNSVNYLKLRISNKIDLKFASQQSEIIIPVNSSLIEWVIENITKNAVDAMEGKGKIDITLKQENSQVIIDISDNGKGIPQAKLKTVFQPGYTTKSRGWGLGLSLVKRIVEEFHKGKIFVLKSEINVGTTFRLILKSK